MLIPLSGTFACGSGGNTLIDNKPFSAERSYSYIQFQNKQHYGTRRYLRGLERFVGGLGEIGDSR
jgi:hypothetical protein